MAAAVEAQPVPTDPASAAAEAEAVRDKVAELRRKQAAGELSEEEAVELERSEGRLAKLDGAKASANRVAELEKKKKKGKLSKAEKEELAREQQKLAELQGGGDGGGGGGRGGGGGGAAGGAAEDAKWAKKLAEMEREMEAERRRMAEVMEKLADPNLSDEERRSLVSSEKERQEVWRLGQAQAQARAQARA